MHCYKRLDQGLNLATCPSYHNLLVLESCRAAPAPSHSYLGTIQYKCLIYTPPLPLPSLHLLLCLVRMPPPHDNFPLLGPNVNVLSSRPNHNTAELLQGVTATKPVPSIAGARPRPTGLVAIHSSTSREDSVNEMRAANPSESSRVPAQRITDGWKEDAKSVLIFVSPVQVIFLSYLFSKRQAFSPQLLHHLSPRAIKCCPQILGTRTRFSLHPPLLPQL